MHLSIDSYTEGTHFAVSQNLPELHSREDSICNSAAMYPNQLFWSSFGSSRSLPHCMWLSVSTRVINVFPKDHQLEIPRTDREENPDGRVRSSERCPRRLSSHHVPTNAYLRARYTMYYHCVLRRQVSAALSLVPACRRLYDLPCVVEGAERTSREGLPVPPAT